MIKKSVAGLILRTATSPFRAGKRSDAIFQVEVEKKPLERTGKVVGIDLGVEKLVTTSDGVVIENPKVLIR